SISSATCAIGRSVSSTKAAASRRYSGVYLFRLLMTTTLPQASTTRHLRRQHQEGKPTFVQRHLVDAQVLRDLRDGDAVLTGTGHTHDIVAELVGVGSRHGA